jgi:hypothetical protein
MNEAPQKKAGLSNAGIGGIIVGVIAPLIGFIYGGIMYVADRKEDGKKVMLWSFIAWLIWMLLLVAVTCGAAVDGASQAVVR